MVYFKTVYSTRIFIGNSVIYCENLSLLPNFSKAWSRRRSTHVPNLIDELSPAKERRLNQFGTAVWIWCGKHR